MSMLVHHKHDTFLKCSHVNGLNCPGGWLKFQWSSLFFLPPIQHLICYQVFSIILQEYLSYVSLLLPTTPILSEFRVISAPGFCHKPFTQPFCFYLHLPVRIGSEGTLVHIQSLLDTHFKSSKGLIIAFKTRPLCLSKTLLRGDTRLLFSPSTTL